INGDGTWTLPDNAIAPLVDGTYVIEVLARVGGISITDNTSELVIDGAVQTAPVITSSDTLAIDEDIINVLTVTATDADGDTLSFSIVDPGDGGAADGALFNINSGSGALTFNSAPDYGNPQDAGSDNVYEVTVRAGDGALFGEQIISVTVNDRVGNIYYAKSGAPDDGSTEGTSWTDAADLQYILTNLAGTEDQIWIAAGEYKPTTGTNRSISFSITEEMSLYGGFAG
ncbi:unnamed protein product, partial [marine sediment metagenome]